MKFRTEKFSGSKVRKAIDVMKYEIFDLGNTDILKTLKTTILKNSIFIKEIEKIEFELEENGYVDDLFENEKIDFCQKILDEIHFITNKKIEYALWLADLEIVKKYYKGSNSNIDMYKTTNIILSNLGLDGILYGYEEMPIKEEIVLLK